MRYIIFFLFTLVIIPGNGQTLSDLFKSMPQEVIPGFTEADKTMLLVDTSHTVIPYALGEIKRLSYNDSYLYIRTSEIGTLQLKLLPLVNNTYIICMIKTVCGKACDSNIRFFSTEWKPLNSSPILPDINADLFFTNDDNNNGVDNDRYNILKSLLDIDPISATFEPNTNNIIFKLDYKTYLSKENVSQIEPIIKQDSITLHWNKSSFQ